MVLNKVLAIERDLQMVSHLAPDLAAMCQDQTTMPDNAGGTVSSRTIAALKAFAPALQHLVPVLEVHCVVEFEALDKAIMETEGDPEAERLAAAAVAAAAPGSAPAPAVATIQETTHPTPTGPTKGVKFWMAGQQ